MASTSSIDGLSSGLNTTEIINALLLGEQAKVKLLQNRQTEDTNIITSLKALQAKMLALSSAALQLGQRATFDASAVTSSDDTVLTASASGKVSPGSYDVRVLSVARNHELASQGFADQTQGILGTGTITFSVGSGSTKTITVDTTNNSLTGIKNAINAAKAGVTATIINDGSSSHPYRLVLTADKTGQANKISFTSNLSGASNLNFTTAVFDSPEVISKNSASTAQVSLGSTAAYTGSSNKTYTFTVAGTGTYTIGSDNVVLDWTDGTNSGSILVSQADAEVALVGTGAEGLKLSLSAGKITGGDTFQVGTFAPVLQRPSDARLAIGSGDGGGSPITVTSATNEFDDVIGGMSLTALKVSDPGTIVTLKAGLDTAAIKDKLTSFIKAYNDVNDYINKQNTYNTDTKESGVLFADFTVQSMQSSLRSVVSSSVPGLSSSYKLLAAVGIRSDASGNLAIRDSAAFDSALSTDLEAVVDLFTNSGKSSNAQIEFMSASDKTKVGKDYKVDITQAATTARYQGASIADFSTAPLTITSANSHIKLIVDGLSSGDIVLTEKTYSSAADLVAELQDKINADATIGNRGVSVSWVETSSGMGYLNLQGSTYGSSSKINIVTAVTSSAYKALGLDTGVAHNGTDVAGTINGEVADGVGQLLTGRSGNKTTDGLRLKISLTGNQVIDGGEGTISIAKGVAARTGDLVASLTKTGDGMMDRRIKGYQDQIDDLTSEIADWNARIEMRRETLQQKFAAMESALGSYSSLSTYLSGQFNSINSNWNFNNNSNSSSSSSSSL